MYKTESFKPDTFKPARFESDGKITLSGKEIPYHTICEDNVIYGPDGNPVASIFTYAYFRSDVEDTANRPVVFAYNGGPGSSCMYVHAGFLGTRRMQYDEVDRESAPSKITAATGLDALCHAVESYTSKKAQPLSKSFSVSAVKRILKYLPIAYTDGSNVKAREEMSIAALEAGIAFNNASVTIIHGMSRPIGALYHIPHGLSNAMLIKECFSFALDGAYPEFGTLAKEVGVATLEDSDKEASEKLLKAMVNLVETCHVQTLQEYGVNKEDFLNHISKMAKDAMDSGSPGNTIKDCTQQDLEKIYKKVINA